MRIQLLRYSAPVGHGQDAETAANEYVQLKKHERGTCSENISALLGGWGVGVNATFLVVRPGKCVTPRCTSRPLWKNSMNVLRPVDMSSCQEPLDAFARCFQLACPCGRHRDFMRPPGAAWKEAAYAPPLLLINVEKEASRAAPEGEAVLQPERIHTLQVPMGVGAAPVEVRYRLVSAVMYKPGHYATCSLDEEVGQWYLFDGMLQGEGGEGPNGRGRMIPPPVRAQSLGGQFWSVVLYARV